METKPAVPSGSAPTMEYEAKIVRLAVFGKIETLTPSERHRVFKLGDAVNLAGNGTPKERKTRTRRTSAASAVGTNLPHQPEE